MTAGALKPSSEDRDRAYRSRLRDEPLPAVIIDCAAAVVLAANAGGLHSLGLTPADRLPAALDTAMPAVVMLRALQMRGFVEPSRQTLIFWRHGRTSTQACEVKSADQAFPSHAMVVFREDGVPLPIVKSPDTFEAALAANDDSPPRIERDDNETLKEIARRIREGQSALAQDAVADATDVETPIEVETEPEERHDASPPPEPVGHHDEIQSPWDRTPSPKESAPTHPSDEKPQQTTPTQRQPMPRPSTRDVMRALPPEDIAKLAHELKTPLSAIAAAAEIMRDERLGAMGNDKYLGYAADIHDSATHALAVISDMLAAVPISGGRRTAGNAFDLTELAARTVSSLQPLAEQRSLTLALESDASHLPIRANATAVRQILLNLLTNALKFTPPGGEVRVATGYLDDGAVYLVVRDTGDGMNDAALAHAFDETIDTMAVRAGGGRGIGLRLVRRLAAENGAEFEIDTAPGRGTVVLVAFPKDLIGEL